MARTKRKPSNNNPFKLKMQKLQHGRPPLARKPKATLSKQATQKTIRSHHDLNKQLAKAEAAGNEDEVEKLKQRLDAAGGLSSYQTASIQGQANDRGGDSSVVLMKWMKDTKGYLGVINSPDFTLKMLEVGALSTENACSKAGIFGIEHIDLNSQAEGIKREDFMQRPLPKSEQDHFDIISLSLVLNYVPTPEGRGDMLKRTCSFLRRSVPHNVPAALRNTFPCLFLVLPASCVTNSRYLNDERLTLIMDSLGYVMLRRKQTAKLVYYLWLLRDKPTPDKQNFSKVEVNSGGGRNNFAVILKK